ncbi:MAG: hypothetical protein AOA66_1313 [Candidatus Bathyarchaeota archaeon BA2]|nr:MAG: hypothetical protein AOA66_1313 [Candidatus Bathyarchaeota archaeon BA2]
MKKPDKNVDLFGEDEDDGGELMGQSVEEILDEFSALSEAPPSVGMPDMTQMSPEMKVMEAYLRGLMDLNTQLVIKTAACDCRLKATCPLYMVCQKIAVIIDKLQDIRIKSRKESKKKKKKEEEV